MIEGWLRIRGQPSFCVLTGEFLLVTVQYGRVDYES